MAANWQSQATQGHYPYQPSTGYQQPQTGYSQPQPGFNDPAYQQYYAQYYAAQQQQQQQQAWAHGQYSQPYSVQGWLQGQYPQQYPHNYAAQQTHSMAYQQAAMTPQPAFQQSQVPVTQQARQISGASNSKGISCYNCGAHDHWAANCPQPSRSSYSAPVPNAVVPTANHGKGPVVTKYAVPSHVLAQMRARGVSGSGVVTSTPAYQYSQASGWQQWQGQSFPQAPVQPSYPPTTSPSITHSISQNPHPGSTSETLTSNGPATIASLQSQSNEGVHGAASQESQISPGANEGQKDTLQTLDSKNLVDVAYGENTEDEIELLDIPDMPSSYGTSDYKEPKLVAKPVYSVAPEWTSSGFGEITLSQDPEGRTHSDYIKSEDDESQFAAARASANEEDPIFAIIDLNAPATIVQWPGTGDSGKSEVNTPLSYGSGDTRPTSVDEFHDWREYADHRRSRSPPYHERHERYDRHNRSPRYETHHRQKRKKRRDRVGRNRDRRAVSGQQTKKRKRLDGEDQTQATTSEDQGRQAKRRHSQTSLAPGEHATTPSEGS